MMYIILNDGSEIEWHTGEKVPKVWQPDPEWNPSTNVTKRYVTEVYADGNELEYVLFRFTNIPTACIHPGKGLTWFGDTAKFIHANL